MNVMEQLDRTPVTYLVLLSYLTLAFLTSAFGSPADVSQYQLFVDYGATIGLLVADGEPWRLLTGAFLHANLLHLLFNGYCLMMVGPMLESSLGTARFVALYIIAAIAGATNAMLFTGPIIPLVGGSGALFGMFGSIVALQMRSGRNTWDFLQFSGPRSVLMMIGINLLIGFMIPAVSNSAHIGGLIGGFVLTFLFFDRGRHDQPDTLSRVLQGGWLAVFAALVFYSMFPTASAERQDLRSLVRFTSDAELTEEFPPRVADALIELRRR